MKTEPFAAIVANYRRDKLEEEIMTDWGSVVFYRLPAFVIAWLMVPTGVTPNQLTLLGALMVPAMAAASYLLAPTQAMIVLTILAVAFNVLDCADGPLARATGRSSLAGRYMDFSADITYRNTAYGCYGLVADRLWPGAAFPWLAVGLCCAVFVTSARLNRLYAAKLFPPPDAPASKAQAAPSLPQIAFAVLSGLDTLLPLIALLAWWAGVLWLAMIWFLAYTFSDAVIAFTEGYQAARKMDGSAR